MTRHFSILLLCLLLPASPVLAQAGGDGGHAKMSALRAELAEGKQILVSRHMGLNTAQEADFWPVYDEHQDTLRSLQQRRRDNVAAYARLVDEGSLDERTARDLARDLVAIEEDEAELVDRTYSRLRRSLSEATTLKYLQLEARLAALSTYETAANLP